MQASILRILTLRFHVLIAFSGYMQAQDTPAFFEEIVVTPNLVPITLRRIGNSVSVISEAEIEAYGNLSLVEVLRQLPSIASSNNGGSGKTTTLRIRGEEGFRTLILFDGIRLSDPSSTQIGTPLEHLLSDGIGRIEVLRGPQGLAYGADAGGVVNISSHSLEQGFFANLDARSGAYGTQKITGNIGSANEVFDYFLSLTDAETDGYNTSQADTVLRDNDGYVNTSVHGRLGVNLSENMRLDVVHREVDGDSEFDSCFSVTTVHNCSSNYELSASRVSLKYSSNNFSHSISYASTKTERANFALDISAFSANGGLDRWEYLGTTNGLPGFNFVFGADYEEAKNNDNARDNLGFYLEYLSDFSDIFFLTAGVRYDDNDDFGTNTSYRISSAYLIDLPNSAKLKIKASQGTGFRAPSPFEIGYNAGTFAFPPASMSTLKQEESEGHEVGLEYVLGNSLHLEAVYFNQEVKNAVFFDLAGFSGYLQDVGTSKSDGVELAMDFTLTDSLRLTSNYTFNETERPNGLRRLRRPERLANVGLFYSGVGERLKLNAFYRISRDSIDDLNGTLMNLDDFEVLDLSASYDINDSARIYARVENLLDEDYQEITGFFSPQRAIYIGIKLNFSQL